MDQLKTSGMVDSISTLVLTHLGPKRLVSLQALLSARSAGAGEIQVYLSNPALQLLQSKLGVPCPPSLPAGERNSSAKWQAQGKQVAAAHQASRQSFSWCCRKHPDLDKA